MKNKENISEIGKKKKRRKVIIVISSIAIVIASILAGAAGYTYYSLNKVKKVDMPQDNVSIGISEEIEQKIQQEDPNDDIVNIALFGLDRRSKDEASRSDALLIASIDNKHKKVKISSVMRDTYVNVPGYGMTKITHAYAYGGPQLAIRTLNENFKLNIKDFVTVDFFSLEKIIDELGGVNIDVRKEEIPYINSYMSEVANIEKEGIPTISQPGNLTLSGMQAVAYSRIRYIGNDFERTERQRKVLLGLFNKIQSAGIAKYPSLVNTILPYTETSLSSTDIISLGKEVLTTGTRTFEQTRFPVDGYCKDLMIDGIYYLGTDLNVTSEQIHKFIYDDVQPEAKK